MGMHPNNQHLTTEAYAALHGLTARVVRSRCAAGEIPGAYRLDGDRGPWRIAPADWPGNDSTPGHVTVARGVSAERRERLAHHVMSRERNESARRADEAMRVSNALHEITTRPARAAAVMLAPLVAITSRHFANRDGWCAACSWQFPCADYEAASAGLDAAAGIVLDGAA